MERREQNKHVVCNKDNDVDNGVDDGNNDSIDDDDDSVDNGDEGANKYLTHLSKLLVDNGDDDFDYDGDNDGVDNDGYGADKHPALLSQASDCCLTEKSKQNKHVVCNKDNDIDDSNNGIDN
eukprot:9119312-Ditylum_brightwellii.AAC.1